MTRGNVMFVVSAPALLSAPAPVPAHVLHFLPDATANLIVAIVSGEVEGLGSGGGGERGGGRVGKMGSGGVVDRGMGF